MTNLRTIHREWKTVALGDLVEPAKTWNPSRSPSDEVFDYIDLSAVDQDAKLITGAREVSCGEAPSRARQLVARGDVLVSTVRPNLNGVARVPDQLDGAMASTGFCVLRARESKFDGGYLFHWVKSPAFVADMVNKATGASYPAVSDRIIFDSRIPLPPLAEQRRIAEVLDRAEALRAKRRAALAQLDSLTQSLFLDLFGDPATNPKGWPTSALAELGQIHTGKTPPTKLPDMFGGEIPFATPGDLDGRLASTERTLTNGGAEYTRVVRAGSALVGCIGNIGKMAKTPVRCAFNQQINAVEWSERIHDDYGIAALAFAIPQMMALSSSTTVPILNKSGFMKVELRVPPIPLQREFARRVTAVEKLKAAQRASLAELDALFATLQHRAFRGELFGVPPSGGAAREWKDLTRPAAG